MIALGSYTEVSATVARTKATDIRERLQQGVDPVEYRKPEKLKQKATILGTFRAIAEEWHNYKSKAWAKETARKHEKYSMIHYSPS